MSLRARFPLVLAVTVLSIVSVARGEFPHSCGRYLGVGWSDGYHSHSACPPKPHFVIHKPVAAVKTAPIPWWKIPAADVDAEMLPPSAHSLNGPSLFRQSGEGSSVNAPTLAQP